MTRFITSVGIYAIAALVCCTGCSTLPSTVFTEMNPIPKELLSSADSNIRPADMDFYFKKFAARFGSIDTMKSRTGVTWVDETSDGHLLDSAGGEVVLFPHKIPYELMKELPFSVRLRAEAAERCIALRYWTERDSRIRRDPRIYVAIDVHTSGRLDDELRSNPKVLHIMISDIMSALNAETFK